LEAPRQLGQGLYHGQLGGGYQHGQDSFGGQEGYGFGEDGFEALYGSEGYYFGLGAKTGREDFGTVGHYIDVGQC
jgi:hypothetical protein